MDFLAFIEERGKENNTYFIGVFIIENVEVRLIENGSRKYRDIVRLHVCLLFYFCILNHIISFVIFRSWV